MMPGPSIFFALVLVVYILLARAIGWGVASVIVGTSLLGVLALAMLVAVLSI
jgi:hypothetical protein